MTGQVTLVQVMEKILEVERLRLQLDAAKTQHWARMQVTNTEDVLAACEEILARD